MPQLRHGPPQFHCPTSNPNWPDLSWPTLSALIQRPTKTKDLPRPKYCGQANAIVWLELAGLAKWEPAQAHWCLAVARERLPAAVVTAVACQHGLDPASLLTRSPVGAHVPARAQALHLLRQCGWPSEALGALFGLSPQLVRNAVARHKANLAKALDQARRVPG